MFVRPGLQYIEPFSNVSLFTILHLPRLIFYFNSNIPESQCVVEFEMVGSSPTNIRQAY